MQMSVVVSVNVIIQKVFLIIMSPWKFKEENIELNTLTEEKLSNRADHESML